MKIFEFADFTVILGLRPEYPGGIKKQYYNLDYPVKPDNDTRERKHPMVTGTERKAGRV